MLSFLPGFRRIIRSKRRAAARRNQDHIASIVDDLEDRTLLSVEFQFDYRYDTGGFFSSAERKTALENAAAVLERQITDTFTAITPGSGNTWIATTNNPTTGAEVRLDNPSIPAGKLLVFVGGSSIPGSTVGRGGHGGWSWQSSSGDSSWGDVIATRGQTGVKNNTDFATWGGYVTFDTSETWYFGASESGLQSNQTDFMSVAMHELAHVLGFGSSKVWDAQVSGANFNGAQSRAAYGGPVPLNGELSHWSSTVRSNGLETTMDPEVGTGTRTTFTTLDFAGLQDLGWQVTIPPTMRLSVSPASINESAGSSAATGTVTRTGATTAALTVSLSSSDTSELTVPGSVSIPAGAASATFAIAAVNDTLFDDDQVVTITASASGVANRPEFDVTVLDDDVPELTLAIAPGSVSEAGGTQAATGTVSRNGPTTEELTVTLSSSDITEATVPTNVVIPQGQASATFTIAAIDDDIVDGTILATITATAAGTAGPATADINITDDEQPTLTLRLAAATVNEHDGSNPTATISRNGPTTAALTVRLTSSDTSLATVPSSVVIPVGSAASDPFPITVIDDRIEDGDKSVTIRAVADNAIESSAELQIRDNEVPPAGPLDIDADGRVDPLSDGLLVLRYLAGFGDDVLTDGLIGVAGQRFQSAAIESYLKTLIENGFDADADGEQNALSDGVLFVRYLAGFQGTTLTANAVNPAGERTDPAAIIAYFDGLKNAAGAAAANVDIGSATAAGPVAIVSFSNTRSSVPGSAGGILVPPAPQNTHPADTEDQQSAAAPTNPDDAPQRVPSGGRTRVESQSPPTNSATGSGVTLDAIPETNEDWRTTVADGMLDAVFSTAAGRLPL